MFAELLGWQSRGQWFNADIELTRKYALVNIQLQAEWSQVTKTASRRLGLTTQSLQDYVIFPFLQTLIESVAALTGYCLHIPLT